VGISDPMFTGDMQRRMAEVERILREITSGRRLEDASIGARGLSLLHGGSLTISGGALRMTDETGSVGLLYFGDNAAGTGRTWAFSFPSGELAFGLIGSSGDGWWGGLDNAGHLILSNDSASGAGLARPYLNIPMYPSAASQHQTGGPFWPATNSTSLVELMHGFTTIWHPRIKFGMDTTASGGATEWELRLSGDLIATGSGDANGIYNIPGWNDEDGVQPGDEKVVQVLVRNTTGSVSWCQVDKCYGLQS
jgi:hypothetical protein